MASMTLLNGGHTDGIIGGGSGTCYLVTAATGSNSSHLTYSSSSSASQSPPSTANTQRIAPKLPNPHQQHRYSSQDSSDLMRCKRRIQLGHLPPSGKSMSSPQPAAVARRNERERNRVRLVNHGFATLRQHVPSSTKNKKMSKVDTLRSAVEYIKRLQDLLGEAGSLAHGMDENSYLMGGQSSTGSPTPSLCSEASSPYDVLHGDEDEELMDFASWF